MKKRLKKLVCAFALVTALVAPMAAPAENAFFGNVSFTKSAEAKSVKYTKKQAEKRLKKWMKKNGKWKKKYIIEYQGKRGKNKQNYRFIISYFIDKNGMPDRTTAAIYDVNKYTGKIKRVEY